MVHAVDVCRSSHSHSWQEHSSHGDVKPENILVDARGVLKVGDIGISKVPYAEEYSSSLYTQMLAGMYPFMAPKVFYNHYSLKSDYFSTV